MTFFRIQSKRELFLHKHEVTSGLNNQVATSVYPYKEDRMYFTNNKNK